MNDRLILTIDNETGAPTRTWYVEHRAVGEDWTGAWCIVRAATEDEIRNWCAFCQRALVRAEEI